jgi:hypothetical protein
MKSSPEQIVSTSALGQSLALETLDAEKEVSRTDFKDWRRWLALPFVP